MISPSHVLAALGDGVVAVDREARVIVWTPAAERLFRVRAEEALGRELPPGLGLRLESLPVGRQRRLMLHTREGSPFPATVTMTPLPGPDGSVEGAVLLVKDLRPWIGPVQAEPGEGEEDALAERLGAAFRGIVEATGMDLERGGRLGPLAQSLAEQGRRLLPGISCLIAIVPPTRQEVFTCLAGAGPLAERLVGVSLDLEGSVLGGALAENRVVESSDMQRIGVLASLFVECGIHTMRAVPMSTGRPLRDGRRTLGAIVYFRAEPVPFSTPERRLLDDFGALAAVILQGAEFRMAAERDMARLQLAVDGALDLARSLDFAEVVRRLVRRAAVTGRADRCLLFRVEGDEEGEASLVDGYDVGGQERIPSCRQRIETLPLVREAVCAREPVLDVPYRPEDLPETLRRVMADVRHTIAVPLLHAGRVAAVLVLCRRHEPPFGAEDRNALEMLSGPAILALRNALLFARTEEASRVKTDFLDMAAHELRTPLTVINGYLSILLGGALGPIPPAWEEPLRILDAKSAELRRLVDDLLLAARLETGRLNSVQEPVDLRELASEVAQAAGGVPELALPPVPVMVKGDRDQLTCLLGHLVSNALAYGRDGVAPWAQITVESLDGRGEARVLVEDRGRGLAPGQEEHIFERFARVEDPDHPMVPGTGLGLYIARGLAVRHGGRLLLEWSRPGVGSRFALYLPLLVGPGARPGPASSEVNGERADRREVTPRARVR
ncbi:MAG TPA: GAF domain-containing protein [Candidatus Dormibacteraeota bacterium]|nr:GAF domain-containing protein [Candidatus Dormibacteraeota bacterium]